MGVLQPPGWPRPRGYANGVAADSGGTLVFVAGQIGWDETGAFPPQDLPRQVPRTFGNVPAVPAEAGRPPPPRPPPRWGGSRPREDLPGQVRRTLGNVLAVLAEAGGRAEHVTRLSWYVTDREEYLASAREIGAVYREVMGGHYPAMAVMQVVALIEAQARVEIEATAVVPQAVR